VEPTRGKPRGILAKESKNNYCANSYHYFRETSNCDILRLSVKYQKYRYAKKTQLFLDLKKYRYVGEIKVLRAEMKLMIQQKSAE